MTPIVWPKKTRTRLFASALLTLGAFAANPNGPRRVETLSAGWMLSRTEPTRADDSAWSPVTMPHSYGWEQAEAGNRDHDRGTAWYRRSLAAPDLTGGRRAFLWFGAAGVVAEVALDGKTVGGHRGGFTAFCLEITPHLKAGATHDLVVRCEGKAKDVSGSGDYSVFGGLYRPVKLIVTEKACISPLDFGGPGVAVFQKAVAAERADLDVRVRLSGTAPGQQVRLTLLDAAGKSVAAAQTSLSGEDALTLPLVVAKPRLWNGVLDPYLHRLETEVLDGKGKVLDAVSEPVGLRSLRIDPKRGLLLNGRVYPMRGVNRHQMRQGRGFALTEADEETDVKLIREMGATAVRTSHYPQSGSFLSLCDREGLLVWSELTSGWNPTGPYISNLQRELVEMIRQQVNHPSVFTWSLFNERKPTAEFTPLVTNLNRLAHLEDPTRFTIAANNKDCPEINHVPDALGWNRYPMWYTGKALSNTVDADEAIAKTFDKLPETTRDGSFCMSEYGAGASLLHHEPWIPRNPEPKGKWHPEEYQAWAHERMWAALRNKPHIWGVFIWQMFDITTPTRDEGDRTGVNDKGLVTMDRATRKDAFYFYKANWNPEPMVHLTSRRYTERNQTATEVRLYAVADKVELFVNGVSLGSRVPDDLRVVSFAAVPLAPGENKIEAVATAGGRKLTDSAVWNVRSGSNR